MTKFDELPAQAKAIIREEAKAHGVSVDDLFPDYRTIQSADRARKAAVVRLHAFYNVVTIAEMFGVSRVAINNAVRGDAPPGAPRGQRGVKGVGYPGQGVVVPPILSKYDRKPKAGA